MLPPIFGQILMITFSIILCIFTLMLMSGFGVGVYFVVRALRDIKERKLSTSPFNPHAKQIWEQVEKWRIALDKSEGSD